MICFRRRRPKASGRVHHVSDLGPLTLLDASATTDADGRQVTLAVVNRDRGIVATVDLGGAAFAGEIAMAEVNGPDVAAVNSFDDPRAVEVREHRRALEAQRFEHRFPAHSVRSCGSRRGRKSGGSVLGGAGLLRTGSRRDRKYLGVLTRGTRARRSVEPGNAS
jgi:hypothetical protein